jgi:hypothetical protein
MKNLLTKLSTDELIQQFEDIRDELNLKSIQNYRKGKREDGTDKPYNVVNNHLKKGKIKGTQVDGTSYVVDRG